MKPKTIMVLEMCIENGVSLGYTRAYKYSDDPSSETIKQTIISAVANEIYEWFTFGEEDEQ